MARAADRLAIEPIEIAPWGHTPAAATDTSTFSARMARLRTSCRGGPGMAAKRPFGSEPRDGLTTRTDESDRGRDRLRDREPEGRGREDDDRRQHGRLRRRRRPPDAARRPRRPVQRDGRARAAPRTRRRSSYDCLTGEVSVAEAARPAGPDNLWIVPAHADLAGATGRAAADRGYETRLRDGLGPVRERFAYTLLDCPPSLGPGRRQRAGRRRPVIVPVQAEYLALEGLVQFLDTLKLIRRELNPALEMAGVLITMHDEPHPPGPGRRARAARALPALGLRDRDPPQRPGRRGAELRQPGDPSTTRSRRDRRPTATLAEEVLDTWLNASEAWEGPRGDPARERGRADRSCGELPLDLIEPNPRAAPDELRRLGLRRAGRLDRVEPGCCSR